ncbi:hypothetical protein H114_32634 [Streptomyces gancidicus BKS 13-15]|uniref:Uncharacterized protein n=1 Tax=Streptomyces gancidicus BKS 13-15 TaxID=1284664 RepID=M3C8I3_STREZ|nr:DUF6409 family protein [Streptomyces gancidicus]EMF20388.1 hypothetical protein H114_32634 [Streptomyces gancidicus BKS 13-15]
MTATHQTYTAGDVVTGRPVRHMEPQARRKGIVLRLFGTDPSAGYIVWWYGMGPASMKTTSLMFPRELTPAGTLDDLSEAVLRRIERGCGTYGDAHGVGLAASRRRVQRRNARREAAQALRYRIRKLRGGWAVEDTASGDIWTGLTYAGAVALQSQRERSHTTP